ncbi:hypothetical protein KAT92_06825 [Candidatus Babeliales bacterium]|nr:hypothetical protein [Candidatus Babeliales bacterium]
MSAVEEIGWEGLGTDLPDFDANKFVVELEGQPTPEGISQRLAEAQSKKNQIVLMLHGLAEMFEYKHALLKIEKARALQSATGTVKQREAAAEDVAEPTSLEAAKIKGRVKSLNYLLDNLNSAQIALSGQIKTMAIQNNLN